MSGHQPTNVRELFMRYSLARSAALAAMVVTSLLAASCGGGDGGGGGGNAYSISVSPSSLNLEYVNGGAQVSQSVTVTHRGDGVFIDLTSPSVPAWLAIEWGEVPYNSPATLRFIVNGNNPPGTYSTTVRFATKAGSGSTVHTDVPITLLVRAGEQLRATMSGAADDGQVFISINGGTPVSLFNLGQVRFLDRLGVGNTFTAAVITQPAGQHCTFKGGSPAITGTVTAGMAALHVTCNTALTPWAWMMGSREVDAVSSYGTRGQAAPGNTPGSRSGALHARDAAGNLWMFGGIDAAGLHRDLWRFSPATLQWTWIAGTSGVNSSGSYGALGTASPANAPGARRDGVAWFDASGRFWLFGGSGHAGGSGTVAYLNDLWMYDPAADNWTWWGGTDGSAQAVGTYGTTASTTNIPGGRERPALVKDPAGIVWLLGGQGMGATNEVGRLNDLWKFEPATRVWTWVNGYDHPVPWAVYGQLGLPMATNFPSGRAGAAAWAEPNGTLWFFGGTAEWNYGNDLWRFDPTTGWWTWMDGMDPSFGGPTGRIGDYDNPTTSDHNHPTSRAGASHWVDAAGNLWLFSGLGAGQRNSGTPADDGGLNDLWRYSPTTGKWSWLSGSQGPTAESVFGNQGVAALTNSPAGRNGAAAWSDAAGQIWLIGGTRHLGGHLGDVWKMSPP
jgi:hypothetical protein